MFESLRSLIRNRQQQEHRRPRRRTILSVEALEERLCPDSYTWNPQGGSTTASNPANWQKLIGGAWVQQGQNGTLPGQNADDIVWLENLGANTDSPITWNQDFTFSKLYVAAKYDQTQTIGSGVTLDLTGHYDDTALTADGFGGFPGYLIVKFADSSGVFQIDNNAQIAALSFNPAALGGSQGTLKIDGGTTTICTGTYNTNSIFAGHLVVVGSEGTTATLEDKGQTQLVLNGSNTTIEIDAPNGTMKVDGGAGKTLISNFQSGKNNYIWVNGGTLEYQGQAGATDTFTTPIYVGGLFSLDGGGGGTLMINGAEQATNNYAVYQNGGTIQLSNTMNLNTSPGMNSTSISQVSTLDATTDTITVASGNPCIIDGTLSIDTAAGSYGKLVVTCDQLDFGGTLVVHVSGPSSGTCDELVVNGVLSLDPNVSQLDPILDGNPSYPPQESWLVIYASGTISGSFSYIYPVYNMYYTDYNQPDLGDFVLYYGYPNGNGH